MKTNLKLFITLFLVSIITSFAQDDCAVDLGEDVTIPIGEDCVLLDASLDTYAYSTSTDTSSYIILQDVCLPDPSVPTATGIVSDDDYTDVIDIGFDFSFFGEVYNQLLIGDNGVVTFDLVNAASYCPWEFTESAPSPNLPINAIFGAYHDLYTPAAPVPGEVISYYLTGEAPFRMFVIDYTEVPQFSCNDLLTTQQIILYETSNIICVNIEAKPTCVDWQDGNALLGIQNADGSIAYVPGAATTPDDISPAYPERNTGGWEVIEPESWQFIPAAITAPDYTFTWLDAAGEIIGTDPTGIEVCPTSDTFYTALLVLDDVVMSSSTVNFSSTIQVSLEATAGSENFQSDFFSIQPNPVDTALFINLYEAQQNISISVHNYIGQQVYNETRHLQSEAVVVDVSALEAGIYFIQIDSGDKTQTRRFIVK